MDEYAANHGRERGCLHDGLSAFCTWTTSDLEGLIGRLASGANVLCASCRGGWDWGFLINKMVLETRWLSVYGLETV